MATITRNGYGVAEPNHLSAQRTAQIYAQLPAVDTVYDTDGTTVITQGIDLLENGQFVKYDYLNKQVNYTGVGEWMLVFNEIKLYDERRQMYKDFAMKRDDYTPGSSYTHEGWGPFEGQMVPRVFKTNIGDIFTTNTLEQPAVGERQNTVGTDNITEGAYLTPGANGYLTVSTGTLGDGTMKWQVVKLTTMPDGQDGVKLMRVE